MKRAIFAVLCVLVLVSCSEDEDANNYDCTGIDPALIASSFETCVANTDTHPSNCALAAKRALCKFSPGQNNGRTNAKSSSFPQ